MTYGHALDLLTYCACGRPASFRNDETDEPCCRDCYFKENA